MDAEVRKTVELLEEMARAMLWAYAHVKAHPGHEVIVDQRWSVRRVAAVEV